MAKRKSSKPVSIRSRFYIHVQVVVIVGFFMLFFGYTDKDPKFRLDLNRFLPYLFIFNSLILIWYHRGWYLKFIIWLIFALITAFLYSYFTLHFPNLIGTYHFGASLKYKIGDVPLLMLCYWFIAIYTVMLVTKYAKTDLLSRVTIAAVIFTLIDIVAEPVAMQLDLWRWADKTVPIRNYIGIFVLGVIFSFFFFRLELKLKNPVVLTIFFANFMFYLLMNFFLYGGY